MAHESGCPRHESADSLTWMLTRCDDDTRGNLGGNGGVDRPVAAVSVCVIKWRCGQGWRIPDWRHAQTRRALPPIDDSANANASALNNRLERSSSSVTGYYGVNRRDLTARGPFFALTRDGPQQRNGHHCAIIIPTTREVEWARKSQSDGSRWRARRPPVGPVGFFNSHPGFPTRDSRSSGIGE